MATAPGAIPQPPAGGPPAPPQTGGGSKTLLWILGIFVGFVLFVMVSCAAIGFYVAYKAKQAGLDPNLMKKNPILAGAKLSVAANPDLQLISSDDSSGTIVVHSKKTGKNITMKVDSEKKIMVVTDENGKTVTMKLDAGGRRLIMTDDQGKTASITATAPPPGSSPQDGGVEVKSTDGTTKIGNTADQAPSWVPVYPGVTPQNTFSANDEKNTTGTYVFTTKDSVDKVLGYYLDTLKSGGYRISTNMGNSNGKAGGMVSAANDGDKQTVLVTAGDDTDGTKVNVTYSAKK